MFWTKFSNFYFVRILGINKIKCENIFFQCSKNILEFFYYMFFIYDKKVQKYGIN